MATDWDTRFMRLAAFIGGWSKDRSERTPGVGCVIVDQHHTILACGYNGFPRGIVDDIDQRHMRPEKYSWTVHAEPNAIANAARIGVSLVGCTAYVTKHPCSGCMGFLINAGISQIFCPTAETVPALNGVDWADSTIAEAMAQEANVQIHLRRLV